MKKVLLVLACAGLPLMSQVEMTKEEGRVAVEVNGLPFTSFYYSGADVPKPYLHPLNTASGKRITRMYPMENIPGETHDHKHHRGLWYTHGDVNGIDFWMNEKDYKKPGGIIELGKLEKVQGGKKQGQIISTHLWKTPQGGPVLEERRIMTFHAGKDNRVVDFDVTFTAQADSVKFGDTKEGFFAIRLRDELTEKKGATLVNAAGAKGMKQVWGKASPWNDYFGNLEGETVGVAILDHPSNPKHPTYWHSRDYGLFAANAFGEHDFFNDKTRDGSMTLKKGENLRFRYRVVIHSGDTASAGIAKAFTEYAKTK